MTKRAAPAKVVRFRSQQPDGEAVRRQLLRAVEDAWRTDGRSPSYRELSAALDGRALSLVKYHADVLVKQGVLRRVPGSRGLLLVRPAGLPMLGAIAAGAPLDVFDTGDVELLDLETLARALPGKRQSLTQGVFALRVRGDSMIEDGILDGDYALIAASPTVAQGAIAVALHRSANGGNGEVTLKHVDVDADAVRLRPANPAYPVRVIAWEERDREWTVQGALVEVRRRYA
jgi:repressor LexA